MLRFSESVIGGITFSWVENNSVNGQTPFTAGAAGFVPVCLTQPKPSDLVRVGEPEINTVRPFTKGDLSQIPLHEIIKNFLILEVGNIPENPLMFLYPDVPRDEAFGKYYSQKAGGESHQRAHILAQIHFLSRLSGLAPDLGPPDQSRHSSAGWSFHDGGCQE